MGSKCDGEINVFLHEYGGNLRCPCFLMRTQPVHSSTWGQGNARPLRYVDKNRRDIKPPPRGPNFEVFFFPSVLNLYRCTMIFTPLLLLLFSATGTLVLGQKDKRPLVDSAKYRRLLKRSDLLLQANKLSDFAFAPGAGGNRGFGGPGHNATINYLYSTIAATEAYDVYLQPFTERYAAANGTFDVDGEDVVFYPARGSPKARALKAQLAAVHGEGCNDADYGGAVKGKIALLMRGNCTITYKSFMARKAGAVGCIIFNVGPPPPVQCATTNIPPPDRAYQERCSMAASSTCPTSCRQARSRLPTASSSCSSSGRERNSSASSTSTPSPRTASRTTSSRRPKAETQTRSLSSARIRIRCRWAPVSSTRQCVGGRGN